MARKLTDLEIPVRIVPTTIQWPPSDVKAWRRLRDGAWKGRLLLGSNRFAFSLIRLFVNQPAPTSQSSLFGFFGALSVQPRLGASLLELADKFIVAMKPIAAIPLI